MPPTSAPIELRAHHVAAIAENSRLSRKNLADLLIRNNYVENPNHGFVDFLFNLTRLFGNPFQLFEVTLDAPDFVCRACPYYNKTKQDCDDPRRQKNPPKESVFYKTKDQSTLDEKGISPGTYTAQELREIFAFNYYILNPPQPF